MLIARMISIGTLRVGKAACVPPPASLILDCLVIPSEPQDCQYFRATASPNGALLMNGQTESRERHAPQPATAIASHRVCPDKVAEYVGAQMAITDAARRFDGFIGTEVLGPVAGLQDEWVAIFRLESNQAMKRWLASPERLQLA